MSGGMRCNVRQLRSRHCSRLRLEDPPQDSCGDESCEVGVELGYGAGFSQEDSCFYVSGLCRPGEVCGRDEGGLSVHDDRLGMDDSTAGLRRVERARVIPQFRKASAGPMFLPEVRAEGGYEDRGGLKGFGPTMGKVEEEDDAG